MDCILVDPQEWWIGAHRVDRWVQKWPGGFWTEEEPVEMISRAYLKMSEALAWVSWPVKPGQRCVELGCAPGGASQALLSHGLRVVGIDPAAVDAKVVDHPNFQHIRKRSRDVRLRDFQEFQWLTADMSIAPSDTLDEVERIVCHRANRVWGLILTLKLNDWNLAEQIPSYLERVRSWGYSRVRESGNSATIVRKSAWQVCDQHARCVAALTIVGRYPDGHPRQFLALPACYESTACKKQGTGV